MKIAGFIVTNAEAYELLSGDERLVDAMEATREEAESLVAYSTIRAHHDYLMQLKHARGGVS